MKKWQTPIYNVATILKENKQLMKVNGNQLSILRFLSVIVNGIQKDNKLNHNKTLMLVGNDSVDDIKKLEKKYADVQMEMTFLLS